MPLDPDDPRAPYIQIAAQVTAAIRDGRHAPGTCIPSTTELVSEYGVAPMTARHAVDVLAEKGLVVRRKGAGVYVRFAPPRPVPRTEVLALATAIDDDHTYDTMPGREAADLIVAQLRELAGSPPDVADTGPATPTPGGTDEPELGHDPTRDAGRDRPERTG